MPARPQLLYVTDLAYPARGRRYCDEDILLTSRLRAEFDIALCHPLDAAALMDGFDAVVVRNSGPVLHYQEAYDAFRERALEIERVRRTIARYLPKEPSIFRQALRSVLLSMLSVVATRVAQRLPLPVPALRRRQAVPRIPQDRR